MAKTFHSKADRWIEIKASGPFSAKDLAAAVLIGAGSTGVVEDNGPSPLAGALLGVSPSDDDTTVTGPSANEEGGRASLTAYLPDAGAALEDAVARLSRIAWTVEASPYAETDWTEKWKAGIRPVAEGRIIIRPPWRGVKRPRGRVVITIEPGMAFGTGRHETTRMCLRAIEAALKKGPSGKRRVGGKTFLDVGTGTGLLAIAAKKLGCGRAVGIDIDPEAVKTARKNARVNRAAVTVGATPVERVRGRFNVVAANILSGELKRLAPAIAARVEDGGRLILSGILTNEADSVFEAYGPLGFKTTKLYRRGEWAALALVRTPGGRGPTR